jgi:hypothetical protein
VKPAGVVRTKPYWGSLVPITTGPFGLVDGEARPVELGKVCSVACFASDETFELPLLLHAAANKAIVAPAMQPEGPMPPCGRAAERDQATGSRMVSLLDLSTSFSIGRRIGIAESDGGSGLRSQTKLFPVRESSGTLPMG